jgi:hypothetical protein
LPDNNTPKLPFRDRRKRRWQRRLVRFLFAGMIDMPFHRIRRHVILLEVLGFSLMVLLVWLNEYVDFAQYVFGAPKVKPHPEEALLETLFLAVLLFMVITLTRVFFKQIHHLEGFLPVCSHCKSIRLPDGSWISIEQYMHEHSDVVMTHSICDKCVKALYDFAHDPEQPPEDPHR